MKHGDLPRSEAAETLRKYRERMKPVWDGFAEQRARDAAKANEERSEAVKDAPRDHGAGIREAVKDWRDGQEGDYSFESIPFALLIAALPLIGGL